MAEQDIELLSAYIDDELTLEEREAVEARLAANPALRDTLDELRQNAHLLASLPPVRAPRNFTLDPARYRRPARGFAWWGMRLSGVSAIAALFIFVLGMVLTLGPAQPFERAAQIAAQPTLSAADLLRATDLAATVIAAEVLHQAATAPPVGEALAAEAASEDVTLDDVESAPARAAPEGDGAPAAPVPMLAAPPAAEGVAPDSDYAGADAAPPAVRETATAAPTAVRDEKEQTPATATVEATLPVEEPAPRAAEEADATPLDRSARLGPLFVLAGLGFLGISGVLFAIARLAARR